jgi:general secretion pathway protein K
MKLQISPQSRTHSFALIVALLAIFVLSASAAELWYSMQVDMKLAGRSNDEPQLVWLGRSGVELARYVLAQEANIQGEPYDALNQIWAGGTGGPGETNGVLTGMDLKHFQIGDGWVSVTMVDEERYANINTATPQLLNQALTTMGVDANDIPIVSDSILDWVQTGDNPRLSGAKNSYYQSLNPPYYCKEAPMDNISELLMVKGVTRDMYEGDSGQQHSIAPKGFNKSPFEAPSYIFGLKDVFTPFSDGRININTADANVLQLIPGVDQPTAEAIIKAREGPDGDNGPDATPFKSVGDVQRAGGISAEASQNINQYCDVHSHTFLVHVSAHYGNSSRDYTAVVWRNTPMDIRVVGFSWDHAETAAPASTEEQDNSPP